MAREAERDVTVTVREQVRQAYLESGWTIARITAESGVSENTILNIFRGRNVTTENLFAVCCALGVKTLDVPNK